jgi:hypothetical protein
MDIQLKTGCFDDAALVRRVVFMDEQGYENEFDQIDEASDCIHVTLYVDGQLAGCSRVFPEALGRTADAEAPVSPACDLDEGVAAGETYIMGRVAVLPLYAKAGYAQIAPVDYEDEGQPHAWMAKRVDGR